MIFKSPGHISERVIFPITLSQSNGIEDARFVKFEEGGHSSFYATYTAYSGKAIRSELIETRDSSFPNDTPQRCCCAQQRDGAVSQENQGEIRHDWTAGQ